jgi:hypothetical protein
MRRHRVGQWCASDRQQLGASTPQLEEVTDGLRAASWLRAANAAREAESQCVRATGVMRQTWLAARPNAARARQAVRAAPPAVRCIKAATNRYASAQARRTSSEKSSRNPSSSIHTSACPTVAYCDASTP